MILVKLQLIQIIPPQPQPVLQDQVEPRRQRTGELGQVLVQLPPRHVADLRDLVRIRLDGDVRLQEQHVVDLVLAPFPVTAVLVVDAGDVLHLRDGNLLHGYPQLVVEPPLRGTFYADGVCFLVLSGDVGYRMATAGVRVMVRVSNLKRKN